MSHPLCWITQSKRRLILELYSHHPTRKTVDVGCESAPTHHAHVVFPPLSFTVSQTWGFPSPPQVSSREHKNRTQLHLLTGETIFIERHKRLLNSDDSFVLIHEGYENHSTVKLILSGRKTVRWGPGCCEQFGLPVESNLSIGCKAISLKERTLNG